MDDIQPSDEIPKEDCLNAANGLIEDLKKQNKSLEDSNRFLNGELRNVIWKNEELEKKLNTRKKLWGFSWNNVLIFPFVATFLILAFANFVGHCSSGYATAGGFFFLLSVMGMILSLISFFMSFCPPRFSGDKKCKLSSILMFAICLGLFIHGFLKLVKIDVKAGAISEKVTAITKEIQSPEALLKKAQAEKEKLEQKLKDVEEELKKKQSSY